MTDEEKAYIDTSRRVEAAPRHGHLVPKSAADRRAEVYEQIVEATWQGVIQGLLFRVAELEADLAYERDPRGLGLGWRKACMHEGSAGSREAWLHENGALISLSPKGVWQRWWHAPPNDFRWISCPDAPTAAKEAIPATREMRELWQQEELKRPPAP